MHLAKFHQQVKGGDPFPLFSTGGISPGVLHPALGYPVKDRHEHTGKQRATKMIKGSSPIRRGWEMELSSLEKKRLSIYWGGGDSHFTHSWQSVYTTLPSLQIASHAAMHESHYFSLRLKGVILVCLKPINYLVKGIQQISPLQLFCSESLCI